MTATIPMTAARATRMRRLNLAGGILTVLTVLGAIFWAFPLYWSIVTSLKFEQDVVRPGVHLVPERWTLDAYTFVLLNTQIGRWYLNSLMTSAAVTIIVVMMSAGRATRSRSSTSPAGG
ncbi:sugar transporter integral membrane protein (permease) [Rubellimicrobium mesophilum DSM 19309]|uniref:Sugar transporter integral membrane protein (Permease) n=1 Tax=Rubellimicrobium mesophilum DSM 19309 TaxID=442562 RepID=A0A017HQ50_9RHOB|nr:hypothetical protein [Rubellimicrobium mesophilum]EYD76602.1 sugar transporter integral membrane protein (permease) [Rubellimicrobium mesophilum DSM 19309]